METKVHNHSKSIERFAALCIASRHFHYSVDKNRIKKLPQIMHLYSIIWAILHQQCIFFVLFNKAVYKMDYVGYCIQNASDYNKPVFWLVHFFIYFFITLITLKKQIYLALPSLLSVCHCLDISFTGNTLYNIFCFKMSLLNIILHIFLFQVAWVWWTGCSSPWRDGTCCSCASALSLYGLWTWNYGMHVSLYCIMAVVLLKADFHPKM